MLEPPPQISLFRAQRIPCGAPWLSGAFPGFRKFVQDRTEARRKLKVARGQVARFPEKLFDLPQSHETKGRPRPRSLEGGGQNANWASRIQEICPGSYGDSKKTEGPGWTGCPFQFFPLRPWSPLRNSRSWRVLATANRRDWSVRNSKCFCRVFHLSRNDRIAKGIVARNDF